MAETKEEDDREALDHSHQKRKPDLDCFEEGEKNEIKKKKIDEEEEEEEEEEREMVRSVDKGKGKMIMEEEEEDEEDGDDSDSDSDDAVARGEEGEYESDFEDDPLAEVDLDNILPSRTRRRAPPEPGTYLVNDQDAEDDDDDDDDDDGFQ